MGCNSIDIAMSKYSRTSTTPMGRFLSASPSHLRVFPDLTCKYVCWCFQCFPHPRSGTGHGCERPPGSSTETARGRVIPVWSPAQKSNPLLHFVFCAPNCSLSIGANHQRQATSAVQCFVLHQIVSLWWWTRRRRGNRSPSMSYCPSEVEERVLGGGLPAPSHYPLSQSSSYQYSTGTATTAAAASPNANISFQIEAIKPPHTNTPLY